MGDLMPPVYCPQCRKAISPDNDYCPHCGAATSIGARREGEVRALCAPSIQNIRRSTKVIVFCGVLVTVLLAFGLYFYFGDRDGSTPRAKRAGGTESEVEQALLRSLQTYEQTIDRLEKRNEELSREQDHALDRGDIVTVNRMGKEIIKVLEEMLYWTKLRNQAMYQLAEYYLSTGQREKAILYFGKLSCIHDEPGPSARQRLRQLGL